MSSKTTRFEDIDLELAELEVLCKFASDPDGEMYQPHADLRIFQKLREIESAEVNMEIHQHADKPKLLAIRLRMKRKLQLKRRQKLISFMEATMEKIDQLVNKDPDFFSKEKFDKYLRNQTGGSGIEDILNVIAKDNLS